MYCPTNWSSNWVISNRVSAYVTGPWSAQYHIDGKLLKRVETALANSCSYRDMLSTRSLVDSYLVPDVEGMEDAVIGVLNMKYPHSGGTKKGRSKDAPPKKWVNTVGKASSLKTLPSPTPKASEVGGAASSVGLTTSSPPTKSKPRLTEDRPEHLAPYISEFTRLVRKKRFGGLWWQHPQRAGWAILFSAFHLGCMTTYYKTKVGRYDCKMKDDIQSTKNKVDAAEKKTWDLNLENLKFAEQTSLT